jgi:glycosyltransferase involved in cell wall biosynthesis
MKDIVSIITPSYNSENFISETISSVISQTYENWEMLITDDSSTDNTIKIIQNFCEKDARIKLIALHENGGPAYARNVAIKASKGRYVAFLDADDLWHPEKLRKQVDFMAAHEYEFSFTSYSVMDVYGDSLNLTRKAWKSLCYNDLLRSNRIGCLTVMYDTKRIGKIYMPLIRKRQDYAMWLKILKLVDFGYGIDETLGSYRMVPNSVSSHKFGLLKYNYNVFRVHENLSVLKSLYYLGLNIVIKLTTSILDTKTNKNLFK